jgi:rhomboid protease GluP
MPPSEQHEIHPPLGPAEVVPDFAPTRPARAARDRSDWNPMAAPATYSLLAINIGVFLWMVLHGVSPRSPGEIDLLRFGAGSTVLELNGQWYRLLTATFVHIGLIHLATNMWCLWNLGMLGEPLIGPYGLFTVYLLTGIAGNLLSMGWDVGHALFTHSPVAFGIGAGASGAVFGIAGLLIVLLSNRRLPVPWSELQRLRRSVVQFALLNLVIGASTMLPVLGNFVRIDNSAHIGGFLSGLALGPPLLGRMTSGREGYLERQKIVFTVAAFLLALFGYFIASLR